MITPQQLLIIAVMSISALVIKLAYDTRADWLYLLDTLRDQYAEWLAVERERTAERAERRAAVKSQPLVSITLGARAVDHSVNSSSVHESSQNAPEAHSHATEATREGASQPLWEGVNDDGKAAQLLSNLTCADLIELVKAQVWTREEVIGLIAALDYLNGAGEIAEFKKEDIAKFVGIRAQTAARIVDQVRGDERFVFVKSHPEREQYLRTDVEQR